MPQMAPLAWMNLFYFTILIFGLVSVKLFFTPSYSNPDTIMTPTVTQSSLSKMWEW